VPPSLQRRASVDNPAERTERACRVFCGFAAAVSADAYPSKRFGGAVSRISQRLGRKTVHTDNPSGKLDAKILEALINLDAEVVLPIGLRADVIFEPPALAAK